MKLNHLEILHKLPFFVAGLGVENNKKNKKRKKNTAFIL